MTTNLAFKGNLLVRMTPCPNISHRAHEASVSDRLHLGTFMLSRDAGNKSDFDLRKVVSSQNVAEASGFCRQLNNVLIEERVNSCLSIHALQHTDVAFQEFIRKLIVLGVALRSVIPFFEREVLDPTGLQWRGI